MSKPRPEFVVGGKWTHDDAHALHGERRAEPLRRRTRADHGEGDEARVSRLVALVAGTYDGRQRRSTPARWLAHRIPDAAVALRTWDAAQDARNRATVRKVYGEALERPVVPSTLARRHARAFEEQSRGGSVNADEMALEVLAIVDDPVALEEYEQTLRLLGSEYGAALSEITYQAGNLRTECHPRQMRGTTRVWERRTSTSSGRKPRRVSKAHALAHDLALAAHEYAHRLGKGAAESASNRRKVEKLEASRREAAKPEGITTMGEPPAGTVRYSRWHRLNPNEPERPIAHTGRCGRSRTATITGRVPRYLSRLVTDPERRVFSRTSRGTKALVVVDLSGSMCLDTDDLERIMTASVGATVVGYAAHNDTAPNCHVLAHRGRRVRHIPRNSGGNGVDAPAFVWACRKFARSSTPVLWITDCEAVGCAGQSFEVVDECRKVAKHYGARIERTVDDAVEALLDLGRGHARRSNPEEFARLIERKHLVGSAA